MSDIQIPANFGRIINRNVQASAYAVLATDQYVVASANATFTLPKASAVLPGQEFLFGVTTNGSITATVARASGDTIGGAAGNLTVTSTTGQVRVISDGVSNWECVRAGT